MLRGDDDNYDAGVGVIGVSVVVPEVRFRRNGGGVCFIMMAGGCSVGWWSRPLRIYIP